MTESLLRKGETEKAKEILDLAMEKMPLDYYGYYTLLEPYISGYFEVGEPETAKQLWVKVAAKYQENLKYYSGWDMDRQFKYADEIITDMERYRALVDLLFVNTEQEFAKEKAEEFNNYLKLFPGFYDDEEVEELPRPTDKAIDRELRNPENIDSLDSTILNETYK